VIGSAKRVVTKGAKLAGRAVSEASLALTSVPGGDTIPLRRIGFAVSMVMDPRGSTLLDVLGDNLDERGHTMDRFLNRCSDDELTELLTAFQEAAARR
jgi:predicted transglutaminase-like cysteine proteinase